MTKVINDLDELTILNGSATFVVSKKLFCSKVQYFEKMFSSKLKESKDHKVRLKLDESSFTAIVNWIYSDCLEINISNVISLYSVADYLMIDKLTDECVDFFNDTFTIDYLSTIMDKVTDSSRMVNRPVIDNFISTHFMKITKSEAFLLLKVTQLLDILKLDLIIDSEVQVFEAIVSWIEKDPGARKKHLFPLLGSIRWCNIDYNDQFTIRKHSMLTNLLGLDSLICMKTNCKKDCKRVDRAQQASLIIIYINDESSIDLSVRDADDYWFSCGIFKLDNDLPVHIICGKQKTDIIFDSGRRGVRLDWIKKTFCWLKVIEAPSSYYGQIHRFIISCCQSSKTNFFYLDDNITSLVTSDALLKENLIESKGQFTTICYSQQKKLVGSTSVQPKSWFTGKFIDDYSVHAVKIGNVSYIVTKDLTFRQVDLVKSTFHKSQPFKDYGFVFKNLQLTQYGSENLLLLDKVSKRILIFDIINKKWNLMGLIVNPKPILTLCKSVLPMKYVKKPYIVKV